MLCDYLTWEERCKITHYSFPVLEDCKNVNFDIDRVYPLRQREVVAVYNEVVKDDRVLHVCVIGSSISMKCTHASDVDLIIQLRKDSRNLETKNEVSEAIQIATDWNCDIIWYDHLDKTDMIYQEIETGLFLK